MQNIHFQAMRSPSFTRTGWSFGLPPHHFAICTTHRTSWRRCCRTLACAIVIWVSLIGAGRSQQSPLYAIQRLAFLSGTWRCEVSGGSSNGGALEINYSFSPDGLWMTETSRAAGSVASDWSLQVLGLRHSARQANCRPVYTERSAYQERDRLGGRYVRRSAR